MFNRLRALVCVPALVAAALTAPVAAHAAPGGDPAPATIRDPRGDGRGIDIKSTTISSATQHRILVETKLYSFGRHKLNATELWLDTIRANAGPEFRVLSFRGNDGDGLSGLKLLKVTDFQDGGTDKKCKALKVAYFVKDDLIRTYVPRGCIGRPDKVRYNAITWDFREYSGGNPVSGFSDYSPKKKRLSDAWRTT